MKRQFGILVGCLLASPLYAALQPGAQAPDFTTEATLAGQPFKFALADALKTGPVVLYFYPAAFTKGCTVEAHEFAEATEKFKSLGATVIGVSHDSIDTLNKFSSYSNRTSYVIAPDGKIIYEYTALNPDKHVENTMAAVEKWKSGHAH